jgi:hypothetical protein
MESNETQPFQTGQQVKLKKEPVEIHDYPKESIIQYSESLRHIANFNSPHFFNKFL